TPSEHITRESSRGDACSSCVTVQAMRLLLFCLASFCLEASGQVVLRINNAAPVTVSAQDFGKLPRHTAVINFHSKQSTYEGPLLHDILVKGGIDFGKELRGPQLSTYVSALASDG